MISVRNSWDIVNFSCLIGSGYISDAEKDTLNSTGYPNTIGITCRDLSLNITLKQNENSIRERK